MFSTLSKREIVIITKFHLSSANAFNLVIQNFVIWKRVTGGANRKIYPCWMENIVTKGENAGNQYFLLFPQCFQKPSFLAEGGITESGDCVAKG